MNEKNVAHQLDYKIRTEDVNLQKVLPFNKMMLIEPMRKGLYAAGIVYPTIIQSAPISVIDILVQSRSTTGKTMNFCCIILQAYKPNITETLSLIVAPTREMAAQIEEVLNRIGKYAQGFHSFCVIGDMNPIGVHKRLQPAKATVGTPGRLVQLTQNEVLNTSQINILILDEAEEMYNHSFRPCLHHKQKGLPAHKQTIAGSATFCDNLKQVLVNIMRSPLQISMENRAIPLLGFKQFTYELPEMKISILEMEDKLDDLRYVFGCLIFGSSQSKADLCRNYLEKNGWPYELISGSQDQKTRLEKFGKFLEFKTHIYLMSRAVDAEYVNLLINMELPQDAITYLQRIGRAGRFGSHGLTITFISSEKDLQFFRKLIGQIDIGMEILKFPSKQSVSDKKPMKENRVLCDFFKSEEDYEAFNREPKNVSPLAIQDIISSSSGNSENKANQSLIMNIVTIRSSIDTNRLRYDSKDSGFNFNILAVVEAERNQEQLLVVQSQLHQSSSQYFSSSNTIDNASSITADISRIQSVLWEKPIATLDNTGALSSNTMVGPFLSSQKLAKLKTLLIDKPFPSELTSPVDFYTDFLNFKEGDSTSEEIDKNTFNFSVATPSNAQECLEELHDGTLLSPQKLAKLRTLLIDKPSPFELTSPMDFYTDFLNFQEGDKEDIEEDLEEEQEQHSKQFCRL
uniref:RNA helicase n=1 Tax=Glossina brevipalpis TaxID=37001 RepID=A0A1A9W8E9_9MUSC